MVPPVPVLRGEMSAQAALPGVVLARRAGGTFTSYSQLP